MLVKKQNTDISTPSDEVDQILNLSMPRTIKDRDVEFAKRNCNVSDAMNSIDTLSSPSNN